MELRPIIQQNTQLKIVGIGGSLRTHSRTLKALECALQGAEFMDAKVTLLPLHQLSLPFFERCSSYPIDVTRLLEYVISADGLIFASPVYQGSISGAMKNIFDFFELLEPFWLEGKVVGLISVAGGEGNVETITNMQTACRALRAWVLPRYCAMAGTSFNEDHEVCTEKARSKLVALGKSVAHYASLFAKKPEDAV